MMGRAEIVWEGLRRGKWLHWTHLWQGGDTIVDLYPIEANLLIALFTRWRRTGRDSSRRTRSSSSGPGGCAASPSTTCSVVSRGPPSRSSSRALRFARSDRKFGTGSGARRSIGEWSTMRWRSPSASSQRRWRSTSCDASPGPIRCLRAAHGADGLRPRSRDASRGRPNGRAGSGRTPRQGPPQERRVGSDGMRGRLDARGGLDLAVLPCSSRVGISSRSARPRLWRPRRGSVAWPCTDRLVRHLRRIRMVAVSAAIVSTDLALAATAISQRSARDGLAQFAHGPGARARADAGASGRSTASDVDGREDDVAAGARLAARPRVLGSAPSDLLAWPRVAARAVAIALLLYGPGRALASGCGIRRRPPHRTGAQPVEPRSAHAHRLPTTMRSSVG